MKGRFYFIPLAGDPVLGLGPTKRSNPWSPGTLEPEILRPRRIPGVAQNEDQLSLAVARRRIEAIPNRQPSALAQISRCSADGLRKDDVLCLSHPFVRCYAVSCAMQIMAPDWSAWRSERPTALLCSYKTCQACARVIDRYQAGLISASGWPELVGQPCKTWIALAYYLHVAERVPGKTIVGGAYCEHLDPEPVAGWLERHGNRKLSDIAPNLRIVVATNMIGTACEGEIARICREWAAITDPRTLYGYEVIERNQPIDRVGELLTLWGELGFAGGILDTYDAKAAANAGLDVVG